MASRSNVWLLTGLLALAPTMVLGHGDEHDIEQMNKMAEELNRTAPARDSGGMAPQAEAKAREYFTDLPVVDQNGRELRFYSDVLRGRTVLIDFIYTSCEDACPLATAKLNELRKTLGERFGEDVFFISFTVDPERDTPNHMKAFAAERDADVPGWLWLTGKPEDVNTIIKRFGQYTSDIESHTAMMVAGNVPNQHWTKIPPMADSSQIALKLTRLAVEL